LKRTIYRIGLAATAVALAAALAACGGTSAGDTKAAGGKTKLVVATFG
jgi:hypothetical protein